jgi:ABC-type Fe3+-hydroxamate transport system, periplasmic component
MLRFGLYALLLCGPALHAQPAERIVTLTPHITELVYAIGAGDKIIATDDASDWPEAVKTLPRVANYQSVNTEALLALKPDLVIVWGFSQKRLLTALERFRIPVLVLESIHLADLPKELRLLGQKTGHIADSEVIASKTERELLELQNKYSTKSRVRLFYQVWSQPLMSVARGSWIQDAITLCGGDNPFATMPVPYPQISEEAVVAANPQTILGNAPGSLTRWQRWPSMPAVHNHQLQQLDSTTLSRLTPRIIEGINELCQKLDHTRHQGNVLPLANKSES